LAGAFFATFFTAAFLARIAEALLVEAFVGEVLDTISDESSREMLAGLVSDWMRARAVS
jgi:hypothetical protein